MEAEKPTKKTRVTAKPGDSVFSRVTFGSRALVKRGLSKGLLRAIGGRATNIPLETPGLGGEGGGRKKDGL